jgi:hypothetical protein
MVACGGSRNRRYTFFYMSIEFHQEISGTPRFAAPSIIRAFDRIDMHALSESVSS